MPEWLPMFTLPNIELRQAIEVDGFALVSTSDERLQELARTHEQFAQYLACFTNEFGDQINPSVILCRDDAPTSYRNVDAIAAFRDAIALSVIPQSWARILRFENNSGIKYGNYFAVYPWMVGKDYKSLIAQTLDMLGWHEVRRLRGQCTPGISHSVLDMSPIDHPILDALLARWKECFSTTSPNTEDLKLFRSLNMANAAAQLPAGAETTMYDIGRSVALWSSAFEILAPDRSEAYRNVYALLDKLTWKTTACAEEKYEAYGYSKDGKLRNLPSWLFGAINHARNDYLHGNAIDSTRLVVAPAKRPLHLYAAPLYRLALAAFLDLKFTRKAPYPADFTAYETYRQDEFLFGRFQGDIEIALSTIMLTSEEYRQQRTRPRRSMPPV